MKRLHIITKPTAVTDWDDDLDEYESVSELRLERLEAERRRKFKRQLA